MSGDFNDHTINELLGTYRDIIDELKRRGVVRTDNAPTGDYAEYLVAKLYDGTLAPNSERSLDVIAGDGRRLQVKARVAIGGKPGTRQLSVIRSWDFDSLIVVLFTVRFGIHRAAAIPPGIAQEQSRYVKHVNGHRFIANDAIWELKGVEDLTQQLRDVAGP